MTLSTLLLLQAAEVFHRSPDADVVIGADTMVVAPIGSAKNTNCEKTQSVSAANILGMLLFQVNDIYC